ncbi:MAG: glycoside hydrolase family 13 protein [Clostridiales bacterium]|nr:glycoside hydrolase family 13 protein [Clostridiales bacterium]
MQSILDTLKYAANQRSYINVEAVFSDETHNFVCPCEPRLGEPVTIKLRVAKNNIDNAFLHINNTVYRMHKTTCDHGSHSLSAHNEKCSHCEIFDYYAVDIDATQAAYHFSIVREDRTYYYNKQGLTRELNEEFSFRIVPDFVTPEWAKGALMYHIFVDRFYNGSKSNDVINNEYIYLGKPATQKQWGDPLCRDDFGCFYGGDLSGIIKKLDYIAELGVEAIYLSPIFVSPSSHKYDIQDYDYVDPHFGQIVKEGGDALHYDRFQNRYATKYIARTTDVANLEASNRIFAQLVQLAHKRGIKVILDGVFNHCGAFNKWLDKENFYGGLRYPLGAYKDANSQYHDYFKWYDSNWPNNDCYDGWWGYDNHPKLNYENSPELRDYIMGVGKKWVSPPFNADGWRLDVAADLGQSEEFNHNFWKDFRKAVKSANPEAIILAEHYGDPSGWLKGDEWDTVMNYDAFMEPITWFLTGMEKHSETFDQGRLNNAMAFESSMRNAMARFSVHSLHCAMNELSNHDHSRFLTRTNKTVGRLHTLGADAADRGVDIAVMMEAVVFQMTWPGCPTIYYGDEAGLAGWTEPDARRPYPWGHVNASLIQFHKVCAGLRKQYQALRTGCLSFLFNDTGLLTYGRWDKDEHICIAINNNDSSLHESIPVWKMECPPQCEMKVLISAQEGEWSTEGTVSVRQGYADIYIGGHGCVILRQV